MQETALKNNSNKNNSIYKQQHLKAKALRKTAFKNNSIDELEYIQLEINPEQLSSSLITVQTCSISDSFSFCFLCLSICCIKFFLSSTESNSLCFSSLYLLYCSCLSAAVKTRDEFWLEEEYSLAFMN